MNDPAPIVLDACGTERHARGEINPFRLRVENVGGADLILIFSCEGALFTSPHRDRIRIKAYDLHEVRWEGQPEHAGNTELRISIDVQSTEGDAVGTWHGSVERRIENPSSSGPQLNMNLTDNVVSGGVNVHLGGDRPNINETPEYDLRVPLTLRSGNRVLSRIDLGHPKADLKVHTTTPLILGRATDGSAHVVVDNDLRTVSRKHCQLVATAGGRFEIEHLSSVNPTRVNGSPIASRHPLPSDQSIILQLGQEQGGQESSSFRCTIIPIACRGFIDRVGRHLRNQGETAEPRNPPEEIAAVLICVHDRSNASITEEHLLLRTAIRLHELPRLVGRPETRALSDYSICMERGKNAGLFRCPQGGIRAARIDEDSGEIYTASPPNPNQRIGDYEVI